MGKSWKKKSRGVRRRQTHEKGSFRSSLANRLKDALDPEQAPGKVKRLTDMTPEERVEMERLYGSKD